MRRRLHIVLAETLDKRKQNNRKNYTKQSCRRNFSFSLDKTIRKKNQKRFAKLEQIFPFDLSVETLLRW
jgi:hypothetical protein